ncbi:MAG: hypothetical protein ACOVLE_02670, partial [Pirellula staleyi]
GSLDSAWSVAASFETPFLFFSRAVKFGPNMNRRLRMFRNPNVAKSFISLPSLVEMKLNSFQRKDQTHLMDMLEIGLIDSTWPSRFSPLLAAQLQELIDDTNG